MLPKIKKTNHLHARGSTFPETLYVQSSCSSGVLALTVRFRTAASHKRTGFNKVGYLKAHSHSDLSV
jgi:hypothetical protein